MSHISHIRVFSGKAGPLTSLESITNVRDQQGVQMGRIFFIMIRAEATVIIQVLRMLKKLLGCDWIHHKFLKLNFLCKIRAYKSQYQ